MTFLKIRQYLLSRFEGTIIGLESLTAVFGMGTGVTFPIWSPEKARAAYTPAGASVEFGRRHT